MTEHIVKSWVGLFGPIYSGRKTHDLRILDRDYKIGDTLLLQEYDWMDKKYTQRECRVEITYITSQQHTQCAFSPFTLHPKFGILSIRKTNEQPKNRRMPEEVVGG